MRPPSVYNILFFPWVHSVATYVLFVFPSPLFFLPSSLQTRFLEGSSYARCDQSSGPSFFLVHIEYRCPHWLCVILCNFSQNQANWSSPSFSSTTFQKFPGISDLLPEVSKFLHCTKLQSKNSILLNSSSNFKSKFSGEKILFLFEFCFCHDKPGFDLTYTSCIICYHAAKIVEIFHILPLFVIFLLSWLYYNTM